MRSGTFPYICYAGDSDFLYRPYTSWDQPPFYDPLNTDDSDATFNDEPVEYLTMDLNALNFPLELDYEYDVTYLFSNDPTIEPNVEFLRE